MMANSNRAVVEGFLAAAGRGEELDLSEIFHSDLKVIEARSLPYGGEHHGIDGFKSLISRVFKLWGKTRVDVERIIAEDDHVVVLAVMRGLSPKDKSPFTMPVAEVWRFRDGKVAEIKPFYFDTKLMADLCR